MPFDASSPAKVTNKVFLPSGVKRIVHVDVAAQKFVVLENGEKNLYESVNILGPSQMVQRLVTQPSRPSFYLETEAALECTPPQVGWSAEKIRAALNAPRPGGGRWFPVFNRIGCR